MKFLFSAIAKLFGKNLTFTPKEVIIDQMNEPRALPMGKEEFSIWAHRIMGGALVPNEDGNTMADSVSSMSKEELDMIEIFADSQKFALANMLLHLGPTESHKPDAFFIHSLRKFAVNQVADAVRVELRDKAKARTANENVEGEVQKPTEVLV